MSIMQGENPINNVIWLHSVILTIQNLVDKGPMLIRDQNKVIDVLVDLRNLIRERIVQRLFLVDVET